MAHATTPSNATRTPMTSSQPPSSQPAVKVNVDSAHLPVTALAWKAPQLLLLFFVTSAGGFVALLFLILLIPVLQEAPAFNAATRQAQRFTQHCYAKTELEHPELSNDQVFRYCNNLTVLYKHQLEAQASRQQR